MPFVDKNMPCVRAIYNCSKCNKKFSRGDSKESLIRHLQQSKKHQIAKCSVPESCNHCGRSFSGTRALIQHLKNNRHHLKDLHYAACTGKFELVDRLMRNEYANSQGDSHLPSTSKSQTGYTPMHCAAFGGHDESLKIMLSWSDGEPNVVDPSDGRTPVHLAAWKGHGECLRLLLRKGGDLHRRDRNGKTPIALTRDPYCLSLIVYHLAEIESRHNVRPSQAIENSMEFVLNSLAGENRSGHPLQESFRVEEDSEGNEVATVSQFQPNNEEPYSEPYEVLARGEVAVEIFNQALREGKACVSRMQLTVIGDVGAGKTSLVRSLSGEEFIEERTETHGIDTSMVEMTELDDSWHAVDLTKSYVDKILVEKVCQGIKDSPRGHLPCSMLRSPDPEPPNIAKKPLGVSRLASIEGPSTVDTSGSVGEHTSMTPVASSRRFRTREETPPRDIPVDQIARRLSQASLDDKEKKYAKISIWDFAGHPLYEAMHHVFLNRRSFYLVVLNLVELCNPKSTHIALTKVDFWLNSIRVHTPQMTPIFLVGTRRSQASEEDLSHAEKVLYDELTEKFGQQLVKSKEKSYLFAVENSLGGKDDGALELKKAIEDEASRLKLTHEELPLLWLHFEEEILKCRDKPDCSPCVRKACLKDKIEANCRAVDEREFESILHFFHDSGVIILPEELIGPETQNSELRDLVVINPQYLVNVMTRLHDISEHLDVDREHSGQWKTLQEQGVIDIGLLEHLWKDFDSLATELVAILEATGLLCPISSLAEVEDPEDGGMQDESEDIGSEICKYIVPFHLREKCLKGKWQRLCRRTWTGICNSDKVLMFDFRGFLPPALFHYFIVRMGAKSKSSSGMRPVIAKAMAIFSFGDSFFILAEKCQKYNQIQIRARYKNGKRLHDLFSTLMSIMTDICQRQFRFLKFSFGPVCPNPRCPGSSPDGKVLPLDPSSDESDDDNDGNSTCDEASEAGNPLEHRQHVICIDPAVPSRPLWCNSTPVHEFEEMKQWLVKPENAVAKVPEDSPCFSRQVEVCCLALVAKAMANDWKWLGRFLDVQETIINNIQIENESQDERSYQVLSSWLQSKGSKATVHSLMKAIQEAGNVEAMEGFDRHLGERHSEETST